MLNKTVNLDNCLAGFLLTARDRQHLLRHCLFSSLLFRRHSDACTFASTNYRCAKESASLSSPLGLTTCALLRDNAMAFLCLFWQARTLPQRSCCRPCRETSLPRLQRCCSRCRSSRPLFPSRRRRAFLGAFARWLLLSRPCLFRRIRPAVVILAASPAFFTARPASAVWLIVAASAFVGSVASIASIASVASVGASCASCALLAVAIAIVAIIAAIIVVVATMQATPVASSALVKLASRGARAARLALLA
jgi:hypothetical protein